MSWKPLSKNKRASTEQRIARALVASLDGPSATLSATCILDELESGEVRDAYAVARRIVPEEASDVTVGVVTGIYVSAAVDESSEQRESDELLSDAGIPSDVLGDVIEELLAMGKGRAA